MLRPASLVTVLAAGALVLSGCALLPNPPVTAAPSESPTPTDTQTEAPEPVLPANALLHLTGTATAANGAVLTIAVTVLQSEPWDSAVGAPRSSATETFCSGELEASIFDAQAWSFGQLDVTATLAAGSPAWPADLPLQIMPIPDAMDASGPSHTATGDLIQVEPPAPEGEEEGYYVPHCLQNVVLTGPGSGSVYLGYEGDAAALTAWVSTYYGFSFDGFDQPADPDEVSLADCEQTVTPLGVASGASAQGFEEFFYPNFCMVSATSV